jgi:N-acetylglucosaminyl-diphospho-decaprenol L-rhamnosyltransferase
MARIAAFVVAFNSAAEIEKLVASLAEGVTAQHTVDVHVTDNGGNEAQLTRLRAIPGLASVRSSGSNLGYGGGMNALATEVGDGYDWYLICNPDIRFGRGSIDALVDTALAHPEAALIGPRTFGSDKKPYPSARAFPSIRTGVGHAVFANIWPTNPWTRRYHRAALASTGEDTTVDWVSGACILARPDAFREVGGFDDKYFMYFEDVDLAWRLSKAGWTTMLAGGAMITHSGAHSTRAHSQLMRRAHHDSAVRYLSKRYRGWHLAPVRAVLRLGLLIRSRVGRS